MKGIVLAAGKGTRMYPMTLPVCKPLLPVYDKPLIYYPLSVLMAAGIRDILMIVPPDEMYPFIKLLGDGSELGLHISYRIQKVQRGIADAFLIGERFLDGEDACLVLGDNIFWGEELIPCIRQAAMEAASGAVVFGVPVPDPRPFGVVEMDENGRAISIVEKPQNPRTNLAVPGLYFYGGDVCELARQLRPSARGELEITDLNRMYLEQGRLRVVRLPHDTTWLDAGNAENLLCSADTVMLIQKRLGRPIACLEETAWRMGFIDTDQLRCLGEKLSQSLYGRYLLQLADGADPELKK